MGEYIQIQNQVLLPTSPKLAKEIIEFMKAEGYLKEFGEGNVTKNIWCFSIIANYGISEELWPLFAKLGLSWKSHNDGWGEGGGVYWQKAGEEHYSELSGNHGHVTVYVEDVRKAISAGLPAVKKLIAALEEPGDLFSKYTKTWEKEISKRLKILKDEESSS